MIMKGLSVCYKSDLKCHMHVQYGNITATTIAIVIGFIAIPSIFAQTTPLATSSRSSTNGTLDTILGAPFFEDRGSKVTGTRVITSEQLSPNQGCLDIHHD